MYQSTFVRYERRGDRVVPVRVTKQWVTSERPAVGNKPATVVRVFKAVRVTELRRMPSPEETAPEAWESSHRVETRERLMTLLGRGEPDGECLVREAGYDQRWLPLGRLDNLTAAQVAQSLDNGNGWLVPYAVHQ